MEVTMRKLILALSTAAFAAAAFSVYAAEQGAQPVEQSGNKMDESGRGAPQSSGTGNVEVGAPAAQGRGDPSGAPAAGSGSVGSLTPTGPGRGDNQ
jgi:hypothetical protein